MPYSVDWLIEHEIILLQYQGVISVDEMFASLTTAKQQIDTSPRLQVHIICDVGDITRSVSLADSIRIVRSIGTHPRAGWNITLREKSFIVRIGIALGRSMHRIRTGTYATLDDALVSLRQVDDQLTWEKLNQPLIAALPAPLRAGYPVDTPT